MKESRIENRLRLKLSAYGFKVVKLTCPGTAGVPDRMILRPKHAPGPPYYVEIKAPGKDERRLQELIRIEWRERGLLVLDVCDSDARIDEIVEQLRNECNV